ncbi:hypothetical protein CG740_33350 [Streptomyces sp. CB01201]|nr:hypothetical protein CG740_33350 [Streptomyces sp. CB01201]
MELNEYRINPSVRQDGVYEPGRSFASASATVNTTVVQRSQIHRALCGPHLLPPEVLTMSDKLGSYSPTANFSADGEVGS